MVVSSARNDAGGASRALALDVLVIDDDKALRRMVRVCFEALACAVDEAPTAAAARGMIDRRRYDLVFVALRIGREDGLALLPLVRAAAPDGEIVVTAAMPSIETAVEAIRAGARDYLTKPLLPQQLQAIAERVAVHRRVGLQLDWQSPPSADDDPFDLSTESPLMLQTLERVAAAAATDAPILFSGEAATGRQRLARRLHALSARGKRPFVTVAAVAADEERLYATLFGGDGASDEDSPGRVMLASGGTLFIEEPALLSPRLQRELWRLVDQKAYVPLAAGEPRRADVRLVLASARDLDREVQARRFRGDLLARLCELRVPSLRERREDILPLARRALARASQRGPVPAPELTLEAESALLAHSWPGNLRELAQTMERAAILRTGLRVGLEALPEAIVARAAAVPYLGGDFTIDVIEREHILRVLARSSSQEEAARVLGIDDSTLWRKKKRYER